MSDLKLAKLSDRSPLKLSLSISSDLKHDLQDYSRLYAITYGRTEQITELIPAMLKSFLESDHVFQRWRCERRERSSKGGASPDNQLGPADGHRVEPLTMRIPEAVRFLSISRSSFYRLLSNGEIEFAKSGRKTLVIIKSLKEYIERNRVEAS